MTATHLNDSDEKWQRDKSDDVRVTKVTPNKVTRDESDDIWSIWWPWSDIPEDSGLWLRERHVIVTEDRWLSDLTWQDTLRLLSTILRRTSYEDNDPRTMTRNGRTCQPSVTDDAPSVTCKTTTDDTRQIWTPGLSTIEKNKVWLKIPPGSTMEVTSTTST